MSNSELIGSGPRFGAVLDKVNTVASANCTVLIQGETAADKEAVPSFRTPIRGIPRNSRDSREPCLPAALGNARNLYRAAVKTAYRFPGISRPFLRVRPGKIW